MTTGHQHYDQSKIPDWARWIAMDEDGLWWCYEAEPHQHHNGWYENEVGMSSRIQSTHDKINWQQSLTKIS